MASPKNSTGLTHGASESPLLAKICPSFCDEGADITFKSSDNILFKVHSKYLAATSGGLQVPSETLTTPDEIVPLEEPSEILDLLFRFIHPRTESSNFRQPSVMNMEPDTLFALAEAAEKYQVFGAMNTCITRFYQLINEHPLEILNHTYRHGYPDLADLVAIETIGMPLNEIAKRLTHPGLLQKWLMYYVPWRDVATAAVTSFEQYSVPNQCSAWLTIKKSYLAAVMGNSWDHNYALEQGQKPCTHSMSYGSSSTCPRARYVAAVRDQLIVGIRKIAKFSDVII